MKTIWKGQRGFSLIELLVAIPIAALISTAATGAIFQIFTSNRTGNDVIAFRQVQTAGDWVSRDALQAQSIPQEGDIPFPFGFNWTDWDNDTHEVVYSLINMPSGTLKQLQRQETIGVDKTTIIVGQYIDHSQTSCNRTGNIIAFTITASVAQQTATRIYEIKPRPIS